jgi:predicted nucleotidyltransferase/biotin operon repressor
MMFSGVLDVVLGQRSKVRLLRLLLRSHGQLTGREIARQTGLSQRTCHTSLRGLERQGIVLRSRAGTAHLYRLNEEHVLVTDVLVPAFRTETDLVQKYADAARLGLKIPVESVILYGSVARGTERPGSDVDLMFIVRDAKVAEKGRMLLGPLAASLARRFGSVPQIVFTDSRTFRSNVRRRNPYYSAVVQDGRVLFGKPLSELLPNGS